MLRLRHDGKSQLVPPRLAAGSTRTTHYEPLSRWPLTLLLPLQKNTNSIVTWPQPLTLATAVPAEFVPSIVYFESLHQTATRAKV